MINNKYDNMSLVPTVIIIAVAAFFLSLKAYDLIIKTTAEGVISSVNENYNAKIKLGENVDINSLLEKSQLDALVTYQKHLQKFRTRYQYLEFFNKVKKTNGFPKDFHYFNISDFLIINNSLNVENVVNLQGMNLKIIGKIKQIEKENLVPTGFWAVYFNDKLQHSSELTLSGQKTETLGEHLFRYRFNEEKQIYLRIVYSFYENETTIKYLVFEDLINIKK